MAPLGMGRAQTQKAAPHLGGMGSRNEPWETAPAGGTVSPDHCMTCEQAVPTIGPIPRLLEYLTLILAPIRPKSKSEQRGNRAAGPLLLIDEMEGPTSTIGAHV